MIFMRFLVLFFITFIFFNFVIGAVDLEDSVGGVRDKVEDVRSFTDKDKWDYLGEEWKTILLKNVAIAKIDGLFRNLNFLFLILLGVNYDLSLIFFFSLIWLIFFFFIISSIFKESLPVSKESSVALSLLTAILLSHFGFYSFLSNILFSILFYKEGVWGWTWTIIFFILYFTFLFTSNLFIRKIVYIFKNIRKSSEEKDLKESIKQNTLFRESLEENLN